MSDAAAARVHAEMEKIHTFSDPGRERHAWCYRDDVEKVVAGLLQELAEAQQERDAETHLANFREQSMFECAQSWQKRAEVAEAARDAALAKVVELEGYLTRNGL